MSGSLFLLLNIAYGAAVQPEPGEPPYTFTISESTYHEIRIPPGHSFSLVLPGTGWYINRFDRRNLEMLTSSVDDGKEIFELTSTGYAPGYVLFSSSGQDEPVRDVYVRVLVVEGKGEGAGQPSEGNVAEDGLSERSLSEGGLPEDGRSEDGQSEEETPGVLHETAKEDQGQDEPAEPSGTHETAQNESDQNQPGQSEPVSVQEKKETSSEIYYIDRNKRVVEVPYEREEASFEKGMEYRRKKSLEQAEESFSAYLADCKRCTYRVEALMELAAVQRELGKHHTALDMLQQALEAARTEAETTTVHLKLAQVFIETGGTESAVEHYVHAYDLSGSPEYLGKAASIAFEAGELAAAAQLYEQYAQSSPEDHILFRLASIYDSRGPTRDIQKAYRYYRLLVELHPDAPSARTARERIKFYEQNFFHYK